MKASTAEKTDLGAKSHRRRVLLENLRGWGVIGPIILYFAIFGIVPLVILIRYSFMEDDLFKGTVFVGLRNYLTIFTDPNYYLLFLTTILIAIFTIGLSLVLGMLIALGVTGPKIGRAHV